VFTEIDCTFSGNSANFGGAIFNSGTVTGSRSMFATNKATDGGAIDNSGSTLTLSNSTLYGNSARGTGGAITNDGTFTGINLTFSGNVAESGSSIENSTSGGTMTLTNTIIAHGSSSNCDFSAGATATDGGDNVEDGTTCGFSGAGCATATGNSHCNTDPLLDPSGLANHGGATETIALQAGSPAIGSGNAAVCAAAPVNGLDQRAFARPGVGAPTCCAGAYEYDAQLPSCVGACDSSGGVRVVDLVRLVDIALADADVSGCASGDRNHDGTLTIDEIVAVFDSDLGRCRTASAGSWDARAL